VVANAQRARGGEEGQGNFARSDAIRDELAKAGYSIKDVAGGRWKVRRRSRRRASGRARKLSTNALGVAGLRPGLDVLERLALDAGLRRRASSR